MAEEHNKSNASTKTEAKEPGLRGVKTTNVFRIVNFELFAKPVSELISDGTAYNGKEIEENPCYGKLDQNKRVMGLGGFAFLAACGYILYVRLTDEYKDVPTYTSISDDGSLTRRVKTSKWD